MPCFSVISSAGSHAWIRPIRGPFGRLRGTITSTRRAELGRIPQWAPDARLASTASGPTASTAAVKAPAWVRIRRDGE